jgi:hypothetical protein
MMAFITRCLKKMSPSWLAWLCAAVMLCLAGGNAQAQMAGTDAPVLALERIDDGLWLSTQLKFELPVVVEDALLKGIPIYFLARADLLRQRWYWTNKTVASVQRRLRLSYHPLTRRWRLNIASGDVAEAAQGMALNQNFDSLEDAMLTVRRISRWKIADAADIEPGAKYVVEFHFALDVAQLPRPLQIGTLGQSDWLISVNAVQVLEPESHK